MIQFSIFIINIDACFNFFLYKLTLKKIKNQINLKNKFKKNQEFNLYTVENNNIFKIEIFTFFFFNSIEVLVNLPKYIIYINDN